MADEAITNGPVSFVVFVSVVVRLWGRKVTGGGGGGE